MNEKPLNPEADNDSTGEVLQKEYEFIPTSQCHFRQQGPYLICISCEIQHAVFIGMDKLMIGMDEQGKPILKLRSELNVAH